jgi:BASS family bile acid:Na+ symporter
METFFTYLLPVAIGVIMFGIGLNLTFLDFKRVFLAPKAVITGLIGQLFILPLFGFLIALIFPIAPIFKLGIVLIAICPGGTSSNIVTYILKGRVALSVSITAFNSFLIVLTIPIYLQLGFNLFLKDHSTVAITFSQTIQEVLFTVLLPVIGGMFVNHFATSRSLMHLKKALRYILPGILFLVFTIVLFNEGADGDLSLSHYGFLILPAILLNVGAMFLGYFMSKLMGIKPSGQYTIAIEMGLQNSALAIFLANNIIQMDQLAIIAVLYGGFSFFTTLFIAYLMKKRSERINLY